MVIVSNRLDLYFKWIIFCNRKLFTGHLNQTYVSSEPCLPRDGNYLSSHKDLNIFKKKTIYFYNSCMLLNFLKEKCLMEPSIE